MVEKLRPGIKKVLPEEGLQKEKRKIGGRKYRENGMIRGVKIRREMREENGLVFYESCMNPQE